MVKGFWIVLSIFIGYSCTNNQVEVSNTKVTSIKDTTAVYDSCTVFLKKALHYDSILLHATQFNKQNAVTSIAVFSQYASVCKNDSLAPVFLIKSGQLSQSIGDYANAKLFFETCYKKFPNFKNRVVALFLVAQLYDNENMLNDEAQAKNIYETIIKDYPTTLWANDSKIAIQQLGKTDEELIKEFEKKNR